MARPELSAAQQLDSDLRDQARSAYGRNRDYLNKSSKTAADHAAQVEALTRQNQGIIRMLLGDYTGTD